MGGIGCSIVWGKCMRRRGWWDGGLAGVEMGMGMRWDIVGMLAMLYCSIIQCYDRNSDVDGSC